MWSPLLKLLETIGRFRFPYFQRRSKLVVGYHNEPDYAGGTAWKDYVNSRKLSAVWGPHPKSPWQPFHCITLFVAVDYLRSELTGPAKDDPWPLGVHTPPDWIDPTTLLLVDLPGPESVALGAELGAFGCDLVCTFNNWPHPKGVIHPQFTLAAMLRYASWLSTHRTAFPTPAPVAWLCDVNRLGAAPGKPGDFDNRYYIEDGLLPGPNFLRERGIKRVVYIARDKTTLRADLAVHLFAYQKAGFELGRAVIGADGAWSTPVRFNLPEVKFKTTGFFRSSAGGFGAPVPHPSSSGGSG